MRRWWGSGIVAAIRCDPGFWVALYNPVLPVWLGLALSAAGWARARRGGCAVAYGVAGAARDVEAA